ncbi:FIST signal transduction protein [Kaarinaea lacus]
MDLDAAHYFAGYNAPELQNVLNQWKVEYPQMGVLALVAEASKDVIAKLQLVCNTQSIPLIGAMFPELLFNGALKGKGFLCLRVPVLTSYSILTQVSSSDEDMGSVVESIEELCESGSASVEKKTLVLIIDAMVPKIATLLGKLYARLGDAVNYMGVNCGSETFKPMVCIFDHSQFVEDAVLAFTVSNAEGAILEHGYHTPEEMIAATSTSGNCIVSINWRPAFEVYSEMVLSQYGIQVTKDNFYEYGVHFPFGVVRADGEVLVRIPVSLEDDGSLFCVGEVPENAVLTLLQAAEADSYETVERVAKHFEKQPPQTLLTFYCAGRRMHMGDDAGSEVKALQQKFKNSQTVGALSLGEIGSSTKDGYPLFHNATLVCAAWDD